jgi:small nuclear ribonucleoprotein (snRNP)-like protein
LAEALDTLVGREVVLDTAGSTVYLGRLASYDADGFWLADADVHNGDEGHAPREQYIAESARDGIRVNRQRVFVFRGTVISVSVLADVVTD